MKKFAVLLLVAFITVLVISSCNKKECPAYSKAPAEQQAGMSDYRISFVLTLFYKSVK